MISSSMEKLLQDKRAVEEINKHKWFASEKAGYDIGFEKAAKDWINRFGTEWARKHGYESMASSAQPSQPKPRSMASATPRRKK